MGYGIMEHHVGGNIGCLTKPLLPSQRLMPKLMLNMHS
ncbi:hypothetical protein Godav_001657, partial [Gossypium davidsonii]|nr:hypothetical protein [Gossypium davidsonii]